VLVIDGHSWEKVQEEGLEVLVGVVFVEASNDIIEFVKVLLTDIELAP